MDVLLAGEHHAPNSSNSGSTEFHIRFIYFALVNLLKSGDSLAKKETVKDPVEKLKQDISSIKKDKRIPEKNRTAKINSAIAAYLKQIEKKDDKERVLRAIDSADLKNFVGKPHKEFLLINEKYNENVEPTYFWVLGYLRDDLRIERVDKVLDTYSASEGSAFGKGMGQSLGALQDRVVATMKGIAQLVKELFQLVREMRVLEEKLDLYHSGEKGDDAAEISLKGQYIDLVEGGATSPSSVYSLATKVGFALLPDLFFRTHIFDKSKVDEVVGKMKFNEKVKEVLKRKLRAYAGWRETTKNTLEHRERFTRKYLKSHYNAIQMNVQWLKPYLKQVSRLSRMPGAEEKPDILAAIEQAYMEIEIMGIGKAAKPSGVMPIVDCYFVYRTNPEMMYDQQMQYRKPTHTGRIDMTIRARVMTEEQIMAYRIMKEEEDFELLGSINKDIADSLDALGSDLKKYLKEKGEKFEEEKLIEKAKTAEKIAPIFEPFTNIFRGFKEIGEGMFGTGLFKARQKAGVSAWQLKKDIEAAKAKASGDAWKTYWIYKKAHRMVTW